MRGTAVAIAVAGGLGLTIAANGQGGEAESSIASTRSHAVASAGAAPRAADGAPVDAIPRGPSVEERLAEIRRRIQAAVEYPSRARRRGLEGVATVGFEIDRADGRARGIQVFASSGHPSLDRAAEQSVVRAGSLPWVYGRLRVPVRFDLDEDP